MKSQLFLLLVCFLVSCILADEIKKDVFIRKDDHCGHKRIVKRFCKKYHHRRDYGCRRHRYRWNKGGCYRRRNCHRDHNCDRRGNKKIIKIVKIYKKRDHRRHCNRKRRCNCKRNNCHHDRKKKKIIKIIKIYKKRNHRRHCNYKRRCHRRYNNCRRHIRKNTRNNCFWRNKRCH